MKKRGQAATEFLMTYGWIVLIALLIIGALNFIGVFDAKAMLPEKCELQQRLICKEHRVTANDVGLTNGHIGLDLVNAMGHDIIITEITAKAIDDTQIDCIVSAPNGNLNEDCDVPLDGTIEGACVEDGERVSLDIIDCVTPNPVFQGINTLYEGKGKRELEVEIDWYWDTGAAPPKIHTIYGRLYAEIEPA
ncbi:MAG: hypothetical protein GY861_12230 [bacterium]|nr:hypothetical protein [bacterium]